jgi:hypothetical protein
MRLGHAGRSPASLLAEWSGERHWLRRAARARRLGGLRRFVGGMRVRGSGPGSAMSGRYLLGRVAVTVLLAGAALIVLELASVKLGPHLARQVGPAAFGGL